MTHKTKGIVLKYIAYGDTSIIAHIYTQKFGIQQYIVKGIRKQSSKKQNNICFFQPSAILSMEVYKNELKNIQFIKEYTWAFPYQSIFFDVVKHAVASYLIEMFHVCTKTATEDNHRLYFFLEQYLQYIDGCTATGLTNIPIFFTLELAKILGFQINTFTHQDKPYLDLQKGKFVQEKPIHHAFVEKDVALHIKYFNDNLSQSFDNDYKIDKKNRQKILHFMQLYFSLHLENFEGIHSLPILQTIL